MIREGNPAEEIHKLIEEDQDIAILVLAAGTGKEGPGPLVATHRRQGRRQPSRSRSPSCRGNLTDEEIDAWLIAEA